MIIASYKAPKGRNSIAQGNALGWQHRYFFFALKGRHNIYCAPSGRGEYFLYG